MPTGPYHTPLPGTLLIFSPSFLSFLGCWGLGGCTVAPWLVPFPPPGTTCRKEPESLCETEGMGPATFPPARSGAEF